MDDSAHLVVSRAAQRAAAEAAIRAIGLGFDLTVDLSLKYCKRSSDVDPRLIAVDDDHDRLRVIDIPGGFCIPRVPISIKCDKGERSRFASDVLSFNQMSEQFNQALSLSGKIPSGHFNSAFEFTGEWQKDAANTKGLAYDGVSFTLYNIALEKSQLILRDHVKQAVPSSWDPSQLQRFIQRYGTHVIVGVKMGGEDVIHVKQQQSSHLHPNDLLNNIKEMADSVFGDGSLALDKACEDIRFIHKRKGGSSEKTLSHSEWCQTVFYEPDVISMLLVPISSLLSGINGSGFLSHAINLYLRHKPPIEELHLFLDFQIPRQWAPVFGDLPTPKGLHKYMTLGSTSLQFGFMGPKLHVNRTKVVVGKQAVTGVRLYLEGARQNNLAIHLQHLSKLPQSFQVEDVEANDECVSELLTNSIYYKKVRWNCFSRVCTAAVEANDDLAVVTGAHLEVRHSGLMNVLFLRLHFSKVMSAKGVRQIKWDISPALTEEAGIITTLITTHLSTAKKPPPKPADVNINSAVYPGGPPVSKRTTKLEKYVDTTEITRGPQDTPGDWVVSGARLVVGKGKIALMVKYSLLDLMFPDEEEEFQLSY